MQKTLVLAFSSAIRVTQIETWVNLHGRDSGPHVDEHFLTSREIV